MVVQLVMIALLIAFPELVRSTAPVYLVDPDSVQIDLPPLGGDLNLPELDSNVARRAQRWFAHHRRGGISCLNECSFRIRATPDL